VQKYGELNYNRKEIVPKLARRMFVFCGLFLAIMGLTIACNSSPNAPSSATEKVFKVAIAEEIPGLNPQGYDTHSFVALDLIFDPLVRYSADGSIQPGLAESWKTAADQKTITFKLRSGVTFQDGTPFNSEAAKWNFERWVNVADHDWLPISTKIACDR
jgi:nickel transport system substrate-binding protein